VELGDEFETAGRERPDAHDAFRFAGNDLLDLERAALELLGTCILVGDVNRYAFACRHADFLRLEFVVANDDVEFLGDSMHARHAQCRQYDRQYGDAHHSAVRQRRQVI
jgi:hypothetical protein